MRVFFITFAFIAVFSVYPKIVSIIYASNETQNTKGTIIVVADNKREVQQTSGVVGGDYPTITTPAEPNTSNQNNSENIFYKPIEKQPKKQNITTNVNYNKLTTEVSKKYKDGKYVGITADAYYGYVQVQVVVNSGKISDVKLLRFPSDVSNSMYISMQALPRLESEVIQVQNSSVDIVSGATYTSMAFKKSIKSAISKAVI